MSKAKLCLAVLALSGAAASQAQSSVTLYGRLDASVNSLHFSGPSGSVNTLSSDTSYWGMRGTEDLGGGNQAFFKLESQLQVDTGASSANGYFNRESYVGLRNRDWGAISLGSHYTPHIFLTAKVDPFSRGYLAHIANLFQGGQRGHQPQFHNSVLYMTPDWSGFTGRLMYAPSEGAAPGNFKAAGLDYVRGPLVLGVSYDELRQTAAAVGLPAAGAPVRSQTLGAGASYDFKVVRVMGWYQRNQAERLPTVDGWMIGAIIPAGGGDIRVGYTRNSMTATTEARQFALGYTYYLSKRTTLYTTIARISNDGSTANLWPARQDLTGTGAPRPGEDVRGFQVGIRHLF